MGPTQVCHLSSREVACIVTQQIYLICRRCSDWKWTCELEFREARTEDLFTLTTTNQAFFVLLYLFEQSDTNTWAHLLFVL